MNVDPECDDFYLHSNGVTILCPNSVVHDSGYVDEVLYTKRHRTYLDNLSNSSTEWAVICTSGISDMSGLFSVARYFNEDISSWDTSNVTNMNEMFRGAWNFNQDIGNWDVSSVATSIYDQHLSDYRSGMYRMFSSAYVFNRDLSSWCVLNISSAPTDFDSNATNWTEPRPVWGTCP